MEDKKVQVQPYELTSKQKTTCPSFAFHKQTDFQYNRILRTLIKYSDRPSPDLSPAKLPKAGYTTQGVNEGFSY